jgi:hypothetical protein
VQRLPDGVQRHGGESDSEREAEREGSTHGRHCKPLRVPTAAMLAN